MAARKRKFEFDLTNWFEFSVLFERSRTSWRAIRYFFNCAVNQPFLANIPFLYLRFFGVFRSCEMGTLARNGLSSNLIVTYAADKIIICLWLMSPIKVCCGWCSRKYFSRIRNSIDDVRVWSLNSLYAIQLPNRLSPNKALYLSGLVNYIPSKRSADQISCAYWNLWSSRDLQHNTIQLQTSRGSISNHNLSWFEDKAIWY